MKRSLDHLHAACPEGGESPTLRPPGPQLIVSAQPPLLCIAANELWLERTGYSSEDVKQLALTDLEGKATCCETAEALRKAVQANASETARVELFV